MPYFSGKVGATGRWRLAKRPLSVLPVDFSATVVLDQQMHVVGSSGVIEHAQVETLSGLKQPVPPATSVTDELQQKLTAMAAVREMPGPARKEMTIGAGSIRLRKSISGMKAYFQAAILARVKDVLLAFQAIALVRSC